MTSTTATAKPTNTTAAEANPAPVDDYTLLQTNIQHNLVLLSRAVSLLEPRFTTRALRSLPALRKKLGNQAENLGEVIRNGNIYPQDSSRKAELLTYLNNPSPPSKPTQETMDVDEAAPSAAASTLTALADEVKSAIATPTSNGAAAFKKKDDKEDEKELAALPEGDVYISLLVVLWLLDQGDYGKGKELANALLSTVTSLNRRTMDQLSSKVYFYWVRLHELAGDDTAPLRTTLLAAQRTAALRHDDDLQATLLPLLLRNYLEHGLYDQADKLVSKTTFPEGTAGNAQLARWYYYVGRIRAIQLNYTSAHTSLQQAIRRAPEAKVAPGFLQTAHKLSIVVELLMGEIPERKTFREPVLRKALVPYLEIVKAVRVGDINAFNSALTTHSATFSSDSTSSLILRLRHNVIKTALRTLSLAYSRISLSDISAKLALDSEEDAEYIVAKAIRDGVIDATVDHEKGFMQSRETGDVYATNEPQQAFDTRIKFLLELHNQSVKAMRYPLNAHSKELASAGEARERERELAKEIEDADEDADLDGAGDMEGF
ncbi:proteasome regulatory subunit C-terminal-domain-containing protein [Leucosporidium creatinivorum]|uniref:Proteasome regulatory subunit C-terminal-domain-containing protein n=1 Tax=Leucosporidium creatinivorum TaxID=106004 RepID=A0A1Y2G461_9BASI|nr:proteasome regulatory subunit C-terminal-domain-containing protein [Leucosporidium creatinivorum]